MNLKSSFKYDKEHSMQSLFFRSRIIVTVLMTFLIQVKVFGQNDNIVHPSPDVQAFEHYGSTPVSYGTGKPEISVPIYTVQQGDIKVPISLDYDATGIRVGQESSPVGLGWVLNAGGLVSRTIMGQGTGGVPGDDFVNYLGQSSINWDIDRGTADITRAMSASYMVSPYVHSSFKSNDMEPDQFRFQFPGGGGRFVLRRNGEAFIADNTQAVEINTTPVGYTIGEAFAITSKEGLVYTFADHLESTQLEWMGGTYTTAWYLKSIRSMVTGEEVTFHYEDHNYMTTESFSQTGYSRYGAGGILNGDDGAVCSLSSSGQAIFSGFKQYSGKVLNRIDFAQGEIEFRYNADRIDLRNCSSSSSNCKAKRLYSIRVWDKDASGNRKSILKSFDLNNNQYFITSNSHDPVQPLFLSMNNSISGSVVQRMHKRLKLKEVQEVGVTPPHPPYRFNYYNELDQNAFGSKVSYKQDYWGYYNARFNNTWLPSLESRVYSVSLPGADRSCNPEAVKAFSLHEVIYPTGGKTRYEMESHTFSYHGVSGGTMLNDEIWEETPPNTKPLRGASHVHASSDGLTKETNVNFNDTYAGTGTKKVIVTITVRTTGAAGNDNILDNPGSAIEIPSNSNISGGMQQIGLNEIVTRGGGNRFKKSYEFDIRTNVGTTKKITTLKNNTGLTSIGVSYHWHDGGIPPSERAKPLVYGGGLRVKEIIDYSDATTVAKHRYFSYDKQEYRTWDSEPELRSTGKVAVPPVLSDIAFGSGPNGSGASSVCSRLRRSAHPLISSFSPGIVYGEVIVTGEGGRSTYEYNNAQDYFSRSSNKILARGTASGAPFSPVQLRLGGVSPNPSTSREQYGYTRPAAFRGKIKNETHERYKNITGQTRDWKIVSQKNYTYIDQSNLSIIAINYKPIFGNSSVADFGVTLPYVACDQRVVNLRDVTEIIIDPDTGPSEYGYLGIEHTKETKYEYDNPSHNQVSRTIQSTSDNKEIVTHVLYPDDYANDASTSNWVFSMKNNNIIKPIETVTYEQNVDGGNEKILSGQVIEYGMGNETGLPVRVRALEGSYPIAKSGFRFSNRSGSNQIPPSGSSANYSYDTRHYPTSADAEYDYDSYGNVVEIKRKDGTVTSFVWGYQDMYPIAKLDNVSKSDLVAQGPLVNLVRAKSNLDLDHCNQGGSCNEQELRTALENLRNAFPNALVTTYTYDPLVGMTSMTDPNGKTTIYDYDNEERLEKVKDFQGNVLKQYKYNYK